MNLDPVAYLFTEAGVFNLSVEGAGEEEGFLLGSWAPHCDTYHFYKMLFPQWCMQFPVWVRIKLA